MSHETSEATGDFTLLDAALVLAEGWKVLLFLPVVAGALVFFALSIVPATYQSGAIMSLSAEEAVMLSSAPVIEAALREIAPGQGGVALDEGRQRVLENLSVSRISDTSLYRAQLTGGSIVETQGTLNGLITALITASVPQGATRQVMEAEIAVLKDAIANLRKGLELDLTFGQQQLESATVTSIYREQSVAALVSELVGKQQLLASIETDLTGGVTRLDVVQPPSITRLERGRLLVTLAAAAATFLGVLVALFLREVLVRLSHEPASAPKVARIRRAFFRR